MSSFFCLKVRALPGFFFEERLEDNVTEKCCIDLNSPQRTKGRIYLGSRKFEVETTDYYLFQFFCKANKIMHSS